VSFGIFHIFLIKSIPIRGISVDRTLPRMWNKAYWWKHWNKEYICVSLPNAKCLKIGMDFMKIIFYNLSIFK